MRPPLPAIGLLGLVLAVAASGCGFHLRTWDLQGAVESAWVEASPRHDLAEPMRRALGQAGVEAARSRREAALVIDLMDQRQERRSASVSGQARAAEYEITYAVQYRVTDADGTELVPAQWIERQRVYRVDRANIVGSSEEQALLLREMREDILQQILRTLSAVASRTDRAG
jgi:LPS-assembly lipoprotein